MPPLTIWASAKNKGSLRFRSDALVTLADWSPESGRSNVCSPGVRAESRPSPSHPMPVIPPAALALRFYRGAEAESGASVSGAREVNSSHLN